MRSSQVRFAGAILATLALLSGCRTTRPLDRSELASLDGYLASEPKRSQRSLVTLDGERVTFDKSTVLILDLRDRRVAARFEYLAVQGGILSGETSDGRTVVSPISEIRAADIRADDPGKTLRYALGGVALGGALFLLLLLRAADWQAPSGRALRIRGRSIVAPTSIAPQDWQDDSAPIPDLDTLSPEARDVLASHWSAAAHAEHASVPAFARLSLTLTAFGAPARLIEASHRAALQEIEHARLSFALASSYAGATVAPGPLGELAQAPAVTATSLEALAEESLVEGCFLEGVAADAAALALSQARDPAVRAALTAVVPDERAHAELAWEIVAWCCQVGGPPVNQAVVLVSRRLPTVAAPREVPARLQAALTAHGWISPAAWRDLEQRRRRGITARVATLDPPPRPLHLV